VKRAILVYALALMLAVITASAISVPANITVSKAGAPLNGSGVASKTQYGQQK
jgi:hypothetical protein